MTQIPAWGASWVYKRFTITRSYQNEFIVHRDGIRICTCGTLDSAKHAIDEIA